jgi:pyridoxamine 5'-phosphate oxidase
MSIESNRKSYEKHALELSDCAETPVKMLELWLSEVEDLHDFNAMVLSTVSLELQPHSRVVLLRGLDKEGLRFFTNYDSSKGQEMGENDKVCLNFFWPSVERQVRIEGKVSKLSDEASTIYFNSRPRESQIGAWVSPQSKVIADRETLMERFRHYTNEFEGQAVPRPSNWGGYIVRPQLYEFWQGRPNRLHDRFRYILEETSWKLLRIAP